MALFGIGGGGFNFPSPFGGEFHDPEERFEEDPLGYLLDPSGGLNTLFEGLTGTEGGDTVGLPLTDEEIAAAEAEEEAEEAETAIPSDEETAAQVNAAALSARRRALARKGRRSTFRTSGSGVATTAVRRPTLSLVR